MTEATPLVRKYANAGVVRALTCASAIAEGYDIGVYSGVVVRIVETFGLTGLQVGVLTGSMPLAVGLGAALAGPLNDSQGRRRCLVLTFSVLLVASGMMALSQGFYGLLAGRAVMGAAIGFGFATVSVFMSEIAPADSRGLFGALEDVFVSLGVLVGYLANVALLGVEHDWRIMLGLGAVVPCVCIVGFAGPWVPESPRYLLMAGKAAEAKSALEHLVGPEEAKETFALWQKQECQDGGSAWDRLTGLVATRERAKRTLAGVGCGVIAYGWSGITILATLGSHVLVEAGVSKEAAFWSTVVYGAVKLLVLLVVTFYVLDQVGRVPLLVGSSVGLALTCFGLAAAFQLSLGVVAVQALFALFGAAFSVGFGPVPFCYVPEVFDTSVRSTGVACSFVVSRCLVAGPLLVLFPLLLEEVGTVPLFCALGLFNCLSLPVIYYGLPETRARKLEDLHAVFA